MSPSEPTDPGLERVYRDVGLCLVLLDVGVSLQVTKCWQGFWARSIELTARESRERANVEA